MANETNNKEFRIESDLLGELQVPANVYYGVQTQRAVNNYHISGKRMCDYPGRLCYRYGTGRCRYIGEYERQRSYC